MLNTKSIDDVKYLLESTVAMTKLIDENNVSKVVEYDNDKICLRLMDYKTSIWFTVEHNYVMHVFHPDWIMAFQATSLDVLEDRFVKTIAEIMGNEG